MRTLRVTTKIAAVAANVTSVTLADAALAPTYGIRRTDTGAVVVAAGTVLTNVAPGVYEYEFAETPGVPYAWRFAAVYGGATSIGGGSWTAPPAVGSASERIANAIQSRFQAQVATPRALATIYDNDPTPAPSDASLWCRLTVKDGESRRVTAGVAEYRTPGVAIVQLFGPVGEGTKSQRELADAIVTAFRDVTAAGVHYGVPAVSNIGKTPQGNYQINVTCPFWAGA